MKVNLKKNPLDYLVQGELEIVAVMGCDDPWIDVLMECLGSSAIV